MNIKRFTFSILLAALVTLIGCATQKATPDPLVGWTFRGFDDYLPASQRRHYQLDKTITDDYQDFITANHLLLGGLGVVTGFYEDGVGQRAVEFEAFPPNENATWHYVLIYDKDSKRIKVIKYGYRRIQS